MLIIRSIEKISRYLAACRANKKSLGLVATMGALHEGHLSLIKEARRQNDLLVVSIFVNPAQFGRGEDYKAYPRTLGKDARLCKKLGVNILFCPLAAQMYPRGYKTYVTVRGLSRGLCGDFRPGHFQGVATVVAKLFNIIQPQRAYFGQKDAQQLAVIKKMVCDLNLPVKIIAMPTIREKDGLAMSSRNKYLNSGERQNALALSRSLSLAKSLLRDGVKDAAKIKNRMRRLIQQVPKAKIDYIAVVDRDSLLPLKKVSGRCLIAMAVWIGRTRLIDNILIYI